MRYSVGFSCTRLTTTAATAYPLATIVPPTTGKVSVAELTFTYPSPAISPMYLLARPSVAGVNPLQYSTFTSEEDPSAPAALTRVVTSWAVDPTVPGLTSPKLRSHSVTATGYVGMIWSFPRGLALPPTGTGLAFYSITNTVGVVVSADLNIVINE